MKAEIAIETKRFIVCPGCGKEDGFRIDHLDYHPSGFSFGHWICDDCGTAIRGKTAPPGAEIEVLEQHRAAPALLLLEIGKTTPPVYVVLARTCYRPNDEDGWDQTFFVEEHTCPTNLIESEAVLWRGDADPHGVLTFVQMVPRPEDYDEKDLECWDDWAAIFDRLPGQLIEGQVINPKRLTAPGGRL